MQTIYYNGTIITMEPDHPIVQAVAAEDGRIRFAGKLEEAKARYPQAEGMDLEGHTMLPAFIDAHSHLSSAASSMLQAGLEECASLEEIKKRLQAFARDRRIPKGQWIIAKGYDHNMLAGKAHPTRIFLDQCCPEHPVVLQHASGHIGVFNTMALEALKVTERSAAPGGGKIDFQRGYMEENAFFEYQKKVPMPDMGALMEAYEEAQKLYASYGITTIQEGYAVKEMVPLYRYLLGQNRIWLDLVSYVAPKDGELFYDVFSEHASGYQKHMRIGGYKIFLDGSPQGRTAWMRTPYRQDEKSEQKIDGNEEGRNAKQAEKKEEGKAQEEYCGYGTMSDDQVQDAVKLAVCQKRQILAHCNGDAAAQQYIRVLEAVGNEAAWQETVQDEPDQSNEEFRRPSPIAGIRPVMIHAQLLGLDQLEAVKSLGIIPSFFVAHVWHWGDTHIRNFGLERASIISPARSALQQKILFTFHQDTPVIAPDMMETVWCAVNRRTREGVILGEEERIDVWSALEAVTSHAAYQYGEEANKGSIRAGKTADFVVLDQNPLTVEKEKIREIKVLKTVKEGKVIFER
ncbi:MAG: amidohydrolase [Lachnospiraceae bacterium]|nr:amidohydrolase [Lachnospiraceae bacterium]